MASTPRPRSSFRRDALLFECSAIACLKKIWPVTEQAMENKTRQNMKNVTVSPPREPPVELRKEHRALPIKCRSSADMRLPHLKKATTQGPPRYGSWPQDYRRLSVERT